MRDKCPIEIEFNHFETGFIERLDHAPEIGRIRPHDDPALDSARARQKRFRKLRQCEHMTGGQRRKRVLCRVRFGKLKACADGVPFQGPRHWFQA